LIFFAFFWETRPLTGKLSKFSSKIFIATPIDVLCSNFVKFGRLREIGKVVRYLPDKKQISPGSPALATALIVRKIYQGQPLI